MSDCSGVFFAELFSAAVFPAVVFFVAFADGDCLALLVWAFTTVPVLSACALRFACTDTATITATISTTAAMPENTTVLRMRNTCLASRFDEALGFRALTTVRQHFAIALPAVRVPRTMRPPALPHARLAASGILRRAVAACLSAVPFAALPSPSLLSTLPLSCNTMFQSVALSTNTPVYASNAHIVEGTYSKGQSLPHRVRAAWRRTCKKQIPRSHKTPGK